MTPMRHLLLQGLLSGVHAVTPNSLLKGYLYPTVSGLARWPTYLNPADKPEPPADIPMSPLGAERLVRGLMGAYQGAQEKWG